MPAGSRRAFWAAAIAVVVAITAIRIHTVDSLRDQRYFEKYLVFSKQAAHGTIDPSRLPDLSPGYVWLLALLHGKLGLELETLRAMQIAAVSLAALIAAMAAEAVGGRVAAAAAMAFVLGSRAALINATDFEPETCILLLGALALLPLMRDPISRRGATLSGLAFGLSIIFRPSALLATVAIAAWLAWRRQRAASFGIAAAVPVIAILIVNAVLTGTPVIMDPGTVFYEGMNPQATGYAGVQPRIVNDLEPRYGSDALHVTYRIVASRASGRPMSTEDANRFWTRKAIAFALGHPLKALRLTLRKALAAVSSYDAWDLYTMVRKERELARVPAIPFGFAIAFALAALWIADRRSSIPAAIVLVPTLAPMIVFYATARQRNAVIPSVAILAGCGIAAIVKQRDRRAMVAAVAALVGGALLTVDSHGAVEDRHIWERSERRTLAIDRVRASGDRVAKEAWLAVAQVNGLESPVPPPAALLRISAEAIRRNAPEPVLFDIALALERAQLWRDAEMLLTQLANIGYIPERRNYATNSVSYHLARCRLRQGNRDVRELIRRARREAPGDADVLALALVTGIDTREELRALHDPFTAELALARALFDAGRRDDANARLARLRRALPEWERGM
jgi:hypothetical protein